MNIIELDKRLEAKARKSEVERLRRELEAKDIEMQSMRDEQEIASQFEGETGTSLNTNTTLSTRVQELEQQIVEMKAELERKQVDQDPNCTMAARDPFHFDDDDMMITNYDDDFRDSMMNDEVLTTPTRLNTSFPSPPSTMPNTPCKASSVASAGIQASLPLPDPEKDLLKTQLESLQSEISKLNSAIAFNDDNHSRLINKLSEFISADESHDHSSLDAALDSVLTQLALSQSHALEKDNAFSALSTEIIHLGFTSCTGPEETLETIAAQFRKARLDLEYLTPGEVVEGFENEKLLDMLVDRIRVLVKKVKESDDSIDQYHEQELLLRQQLNTRVDALQGVQKQLHLANNVVGGLREEIGEKEVSNERLRNALDGYRDEVAGLEKLIEMIEEEGRLKEEALKSEVQEIGGRLQDEILKHDTTRSEAEGKEILVIELERRLNTALRAAAEVQNQLASLAASTDADLAEKDAMIHQLKASSAEKDTSIDQLKTSILEREQAHGSALALRDARVSELRDEISRVNDALERAHTAILELTRGNRVLKADNYTLKAANAQVVQIVREQLNPVLDITEEGSINTHGNITLRRSRREGSAPASLIAGSGSVPRRASISDIAAEKPVIVSEGTMFDGSLARRASGKKRRRYDSGLGFLGEEEVEMF